MADNEKEKFYELGYWFSLDKNPQENLDKLIALLTDNGARIETARAPKKMRLAYPVKKQRDGYFGYIEFFALPQINDTLNKKLSLFDFLLRTCLFTKAFSQEKAAVRFTEKRPRPQIVPQGQPSDVDVAELDKKLEELLTSNGQ